MKRHGIVQYKEQGCICTNGVLRMDIYAMAFQACETLLEEMELERITTSSAVLRCMRIARLLQDSEALLWLRCEMGGYPRKPDGTLPEESWKIAAGHGRAYTANGSERVFTTLAADLEKKLEEYDRMLASQSGREWLMKYEHSQNAVQLLGNVSRDHHQLVVLRSAYYSYVQRKYMELSAGTLVRSIFTDYEKLVAGVWDGLADRDLFSAGRLASLMQENLRENAAEVVQICREVLGHILEENMASSGPPDIQMAEELRLQQLRMDRQLEMAEADELAEAQALYGCVIRTYLLAGDLIRARTRPQT